MSGGEWRIGLKDFARIVEADGLDPVAEFVRQQLPRPGEWVELPPERRARNHPEDRFRAVELSDEDEVLRSLVESSADDEVLRRFVELPANTAGLVVDGLSAPSRDERQPDELPALPRQDRASAALLFASAGYGEDSAVRVKEFALRYGRLGLPSVTRRVSVLVPGPSRKEVGSVEVEQLADWQRETHEAWTVVGLLWRLGVLAMAGRDLKDATGTKAHFDEGTTALWRAVQSVKPGEPVDAKAMQEGRASMARLRRELTDVLNRKLDEAGVRTHLALTTDGRFEYRRIVPNTLRAYLWAQLAGLAIEGANVKACRRCGRPIVFGRPVLIGDEDASDVRAKLANKDYCSSRCYLQQWRAGKTRRTPRKGRV